MVDSTKQLSSVQLVFIGLLIAVNETGGWNFFFMELHPPGRTGTRGWRQTWDGNMRASGELPLTEEDRHDGEKQR